MKKKLTYFLVFLSFVIFAQEEGSSASNFNNFDNFRSWNFDFFLTNQLNYQPELGGTINYFGLGGSSRYNFFAPKDYFSLGIGFPINLGFDGFGSTDSYFYQYFIDIPLELSINLGDRATEFSEYWVGTSFGFGLDYNNSAYFNSQSSLKASTNSLGPAVSFCLKYRYHEMPIGLRVSYMWGIMNDYEKDPDVTYFNESDIPKILTLSIAYGVK